MKTDKEIKLNYAEYVAMQIDAIKLKAKCDMYEKKNEGFALSTMILKSSTYETKIFDSIRGSQYDPYYSGLGHRDDYFKTVNSTQDNNLILYTSDEVIKEMLKKCNNEIESEGKKFNEKLENAFDKLNEANEVINDLKSELDKKDNEISKWKSTWNSSTILLKRGPKV